MQLGPINIEHPFLLAPMAGITHTSFRTLMRMQQTSGVVSELISANGIKYEAIRTQALLQFTHEERPLGIQIFGETIENLVHAAQYIEKLMPDFIDLNLGCPVPKIVKKGAGAALCRNPQQLIPIFKALVKSVQIPISIKIRTGWDENTKNANEIAQIAYDYGIAWMGIHGRTRAQGYSGQADWDYIGTIKAKAKIPIIGNGDLTTAQKAFDALQIYKVDAVYIGRGALRNPFIFRQAVAISKNQPPMTPCSADYLTLITELRTLLEKNYPSTLAHLHAKKFLAWFSSGLENASEFRKTVFSSTCATQLWENAQIFFSNISNKDLEFLKEPFLMGGHG